MNLHFASEIRDCLVLFGTPVALKALKLICNDGVQSQMAIRKISCRRPLSVNNAELGEELTFLFCRGQQKNVQRLPIYNVPAIVLLIQTFIW